MRKLTFFVLLLLLARNASAQIDVSLNPLGILFRNIDLSAEIAMKQSFGIEGIFKYDYDHYKVLDNTINSNGFGFVALGKYYFNPDLNISNFCAAPYVKFSTTNGRYSDGNTTGIVNHNKLAVGFYVGYKWVNVRNFVFEIGAGLGRNFINRYNSANGSIDLDEFPIINLDGVFKFSFGYRFNSTAQY
ncbi:MAG: DUF3575 domain-containing protein [Saprospiraceae bacterium]|nr:DUF3575 domain-containing protein [Saprospiraceae bacterium]MBK9378067.1 DUF3575 domain-containing protein [Saprospiraceae bacterium]